MEKRLYVYIFQKEPTVSGAIIDVTDDEIAHGSAEECRANLASFLSQTDDEEAYVDEFGVIRKVDKHEDYPYAYIFDVTDGDWSDLRARMLRAFSEATIMDAPDYVRTAIAAVLGYSCQEEILSVKVPEEHTDTKTRTYGELMSLAEETDNVMLAAALMASLKKWCRSQKAKPTEQAAVRKWSSLPVDEAESGELLRLAYSLPGGAS